MQNDASHAQDSERGASAAAQGLKVAGLDGVLASVAYSRDFMGVKDDETERDKDLQC